VTVEEEEEVAGDLAPVASLGHTYTGT